MTHGIDEDEPIMSKPLRDQFRAGIGKPEGPGAAIVTYYNLHRMLDTMDALEEALDAVLWVNEVENARPRPESPIVAYWTDQEHSSMDEWEETWTAARRHRNEALAAVGR